MKVHPVSMYEAKHHNSIRRPREHHMSGNAQKKLRRLPHVFSKVLELPLRSDANVAIQENSDCFQFVAEIDDITDVRAHAVEIHPGVIKIVVRGGGGGGGGNGGGDVAELLSLDRLKVDVWRYRLPSSTQPELVSATVADGELIVTVPKEGGGGEAQDGKEVWRGVGRVVFVQ